MATRTITVHDRCTKPGCNRVLHSMSEGERGVCSSCWFREMPQDTKGALNRVIRAAFNGADEAEKGAAVEDAMSKLRRDES